MMHQFISYDPVYRPCHGMGCLHVEVHTIVWRAATDEVALPFEHEREPIPSEDESPCTRHSTLRHVHVTGVSLYDCM